MARKKIPYKVGFWIAVVIIVILGLYLWQNYYQSTQEGEEVSYINFDNIFNETDEAEAPAEGEEAVAEEEAEEVVVSEEVASEEEVEEEEAVTEEPTEEEVVAEEPAEEEVTEEEIVEEEVVAEEPEEEEVAAESEPKVLVVTEGDLVSFPNLQVEDPDGDEITFTFSEPLDENGEWQTEVGDAGSYDLTISASDGTTEISDSIMLIVESLNNAPIIEIEESVAVSEGDTVVLEPVVTDADDDAIEIVYSGWMSTNIKETTYDDAGDYMVTITASDGIAETVKVVTVSVSDVNRAPTFVSII